MDPGRSRELALAALRLGVPWPEAVLMPVRILGCLLGEHGRWAEARERAARRAAGRKATAVVAVPLFVD